MVLLPAEFPLGVAADLKLVVIGRCETGFSSFMQIEKTESSFPEWRFFGLLPAPVKHS